MTTSISIPKFVTIEGEVMSHYSIEQMPPPTSTAPQTITTTISTSSGLKTIHQKVKPVFPLKEDSPTPSYIPGTTPPTQRPATRVDSASQSSHNTAEDLLAFGYGLSIGLSIGLLVCIALWRIRRKHEPVAKKSSGHVRSRDVFEEYTIDENPDLINLCELVTSDEVLEQNGSKSDQA